MSFQVVHFQKFNKNACGGVQIHNERKKEGISHTNKNIDWDKTHLNYELHEEKKNFTYHEKIKERINQLNLKKAVRKDAVVMCGFVISSDQEFFKNIDEVKQREFFKDSYDFFCNRYGKENIISAKVHLDETTPHLHVELVPVTKDNKLSAKTLFDKKELISIHDNFYHDVGSNFNLERGEKGKKVHIQPEEYKKIQEELKQMRLECHNLRFERVNLKKGIETLESKLKPLKQEYEQNKGILNQISLLEQKNKTLQDKLDTLIKKMNKTLELLPPGMTKKFLEIYKSLKIEKNKTLKR